MILSKCLDFSSNKYLPSSSNASLTEGFVVASLRILSKLSKFKELALISLFKWPRVLRVNWSSVLLDEEK